MGIWSYEVDDSRHEWMQFTSLSSNRYRPTCSCCNRRHVKTLN